MKAVYYSALIFPGLGQLYLKNFIRALLFIVVAAIGFIIIMDATWGLMMNIANDIEQGRQSLDINSLTLVIKESLNIYDDPKIITAKFAFLASWIISSIDAYITVKLQRDASLN